MPGFDGTGPRGMGPLTGGGRGFCVVPGGAPYRRFGAGRFAPYYGARTISREEELEFLKNQAEAIKQELSQIEARMQSLENKKE